MIYTAITDRKDKIRDDVKVFRAYNRFKEPRLNAKIYKILSHLFIQGEFSIWIDGNLFLKQPPEVFIQLLGGADIAVFRNPYRDCLYEEANACIKQKLDNPLIIEEQIEKYRQEGFPVSAGLGACFLIIRRHTDQIKRLNEKWWAEICRNSSRDQISFPYIFNQVVKYLPIQHPFNNKYFKRIGHLV